MNEALLLELNRLTGFQRAVRDHFQQGGSIMAAFFVLAGIVAVVVLVKLLTQSQKRSERPTATDQPQALFADLLAGLELTQQQRRLLTAVAQELGIKNPAVILLSGTLFDQYVGRWYERSRGQTGAVGATPDARHIAHLRAHLFPNILSRVGTEQMGL